MTVQRSPLPPADWFQQRFPTSKRPLNLSSNDHSASAGDLFPIMAYSRQSSGPDVAGWPDGRSEEGGRSALPWEAVAVTACLL